jgi:hypothetical protein
VFHIIQTLTDTFFRIGAGGYVRQALIGFVHFAAVSSGAQT